MVYEFTVKLIIQVEGVSFDDAQSEAEQAVAELEADMPDGMMLIQKNGRSEVCFERQGEYL